MQTKKTIKTKSKRIKTKALDSVFKVHKGKGQERMFYLWTKVRGKWMPFGAFYLEVGWRSWVIFPRGECSLPVLQLQYKSFGQSIYLRAEIGRTKGKRTLCNQTTNKQVVKRGLPTKNRILYKVK